MRLHRIGERPGANGFGYFSRKKSDSRAQRVKALLWLYQPPSSAFGTFSRQREKEQSGVHLCRRATDNPAL